MPPDLIPTTPNKRHLGNKGKKKFKITTGYIICFIAYIILQGAHFWADNPLTVRLYCKGHYGIHATPVDVPGEVEAGAGGDLV